MELAAILVFMPTWFLVSISPGMCMTLALSLGIAVGLRRTLWMMAGEILGACAVAALCVLGLAQLLLRWPLAFSSIKWLGGAYLLYLGVQLWRSRGNLAIGIGEQHSPSRLQLFSQGLLTAMANPKAWAFCLAILPPFIDFERPLFWQLLVMLLLIGVSEFIAMTIYASGGRSLRRLLERENGAAILNRISGSLMAAVGLWLWLS